MPDIGIYKITNPNGKVYIGQSRNIKSRHDQYRRLNCSEQPRIYRSILKYGWHKHKFEVLAICEEHELNRLEIYYIELFNAISNKGGMNCKTGGAYGSHSEETRKKISITSSNCSAETRAKISKANRGVPKPVGFAEKISKALTGIKRSAETKKKISKSKSGHKHSEETKKLWSKQRLGKKRGRCEEISLRQLKLILNTETGIFYLGRSEAAFSLGINTTVFKNRIHNKNKKKIPMIYV